MKKTSALFNELIDLIRTLQGPAGCPWDRRQTPANVKNYLVEELYELLEAIDSNQNSLIMEETGDLFFMLLFLINLYETKNKFTLNNTIDSVIKKMIHRHPHVFGSKTVSSVDEIKDNWQKLKEQEGKKPKESLLDGIPGNLPALSRSYFLTSKASGAGFDWQSPEDVLKKVKEEIKELEVAIAKGKKDEITDETGDIIFSIVNLSRHLGIEPEQALRQSNKKFINRFQYMEKTLKKQGRDIKKTTLFEMDKLWEEAKEVL